MGEKTERRRCKERESGQETYSHSCFNIMKLSFYNNIRLTNLSLLPCPRPSWEAAALERATEVVGEEEKG